MSVSQPTFVMRVPTSRRSTKLAADVARTVDTLLYEVPPNMSTRVHALWICAFGTGNHTIRVHHTRSGEAVGGANALLYDFSLASKHTQVYDQPILMSSGDRLWIRSDAADKMTVTVYGDEA
jgi:hypothetical protein